MALVAAAAQASQPGQPRTVEVIPVPPPPVIIPAPAPPIRTTIRSDQPRREVAIDVRVLGGSEELWNRRLTLSGYNGAQLTLEVAEAASCSTDGYGDYGSGRRTGLRLQLNQRGTNDKFGVNATWTRRSPDCAMPGTLTSGVEVTVPLAPGETRTVTGDGGLRVILMRPR